MDTLWDWGRAGSEPADALRWYVLHTKSRQEKALADHLAATGVDHYLPLAPVVSYRGRRKVEYEAPLFPGYVFLHGTLDQAFEADRTKRVANILRVMDQARLNDDLLQIRQALSRQAPLVPCAFLKVGFWVEVRSGPFRGLRGLIERITKNARLILQVATLGRAACVEIDGSLVDIVQPHDVPQGTFTA